jgi:di/tricarboxylate transporter
VTLDIAIVLGILAVSVVLFVQGKMRMDLVALLVLSAMALTGLVSTSEALSGFSNPAVITVWAMFILSAGLTSTGVAGIIGRGVMRFAGHGEARIVLTIMLTTGLLSAFMNNIGVAALMLPVTMEVARRSGRPPSRLLMPLAYGSLLGGLATLIGTPPNLLVSDALRSSGLDAFRLFDFTPVGGVVALVGIAFVALVGRRLLPQRDIGRESSASELADIEAQYAVNEQTVMMRLPENSPLDRSTLARSRLGSATGLNVIAVLRKGRTWASPDPGFILNGGDRLVVEGELDRFKDLSGCSGLEIEDEVPGLEALISEEIGLGELKLTTASSIVGSTIGQARLRERLGVIVLAVRRGSELIHQRLTLTRLEAGDRLLVQGRRDKIEELISSSSFERTDWMDSGQFLARYDLPSHLFVVHAPEGCGMHDKVLSESRIGNAIGLAVLGIFRGDERRLLPDPQERLQEGDRLIVRGDRGDLEIFRGLQQLEIEDQPPPSILSLVSEETGLIEAVLSPRTTLAGKSLRELAFRDRYGLQVLALLREGRVYRSGFRDMPLRFGDALLLIGRRDRETLLDRDPDFVVLTREEELPRPGKATRAALIMAGIMLPVLLGWMQISIAAVIGAALMVASRCLTMEEAYRAIDWKSVFLIAGMLPLGIAMSTTGAASYVAEHVLAITGSLGPWGVIFGIYLVTALATMIVPTAALVVLMAPIALKAAADLGVSPQTVMMAVAIAASASFASPISHPANILVMGPGGYRFRDYVKLGLPLTVVVLLVTLLLLPVVWPL